VTLLLNSGAGAHICNGDNKTPLDLAIDNGRVEVAMCLAEWIGDVDVQDRVILAFLDTTSQDSLPSVARPSPGYGNVPNVSDERRTSLPAASEAGHLDIVRSLLDGGADVNERNASHRTPLHYASQEGRIEVAKLLIEYGADVNSLDGMLTGWTPLHAASFYGHSDVVRLLLNRGADVNAEDQHHFTALHFAITERSSETVKALLEQGANVSVRNDQNQTPFQMAAARGEREIMRILMEYGADGRYSRSLLRTSIEG
jgi:ankyrin repeat protein